MCVYLVMEFKIGTCNIRFICEINCGNILMANSCRISVSLSYRFLDLAGRSGNFVTFFRNQKLIFFF